MALPIDGLLPRLYLGLHYVVNKYGRYLMAVLHVDCRQKRKMVVQANLLFLCCKLIHLQLFIVGMCHLFTASHWHHINCCRYCTTRATSAKS